MKHRPDFTKVMPVYFALTIPCNVLLQRAVDYANAEQGTDAGETLADLLLALGQGNDWNLRDLYLLDKTGQQLALGLIHHAILTARIGVNELHEAVCRMHRAKAEQNQNLFRF